MRYVIKKLNSTMLTILLAVLFMCSGAAARAESRYPDHVKYEVNNTSVANDIKPITSNTYSTVLDEKTEDTTQLGVKSPSCILMEASTGQVIFEKNCDRAMAPASVTKIMTLLLTFEAIDKGDFDLDDEVVVSQHAASMGGSQCFFEMGEKQTVEDMIKCIIIASGNDAAVAMAEKIAGSETAFVNLMNEKAEELGMTNSVFRNACGLDVEGHEMSARDIAIMSRELITKYPQVLDYSGIWMDSIIHKTARGESQFDLVNTNKFLNMYTGATGLKTGYTSTAKYCMSATADRDGIQLIAVIMGGETKDIRNDDACTLLDFGYSRCKKYVDKEVFTDEKISVDNGRGDYVKIKGGLSFEGILLDGESENDVKKKLIIDKKVKAPVHIGDVLCTVEYRVKDRLMGSVDIQADENMEAMDIGFAFTDTLKNFFGL